MAKDLKGAVLSANQRKQQLQEALSSRANRDKVENIFRFIEGEGLGVTQIPVGKMNSEANNIKFPCDQCSAVPRGAKCS